MTLRKLRMLRPRVREWPDRLRTVEDLKRPIYFYETKVGKFSIVSRGGRWRAILGDEDLGGYATPQQAADDLAGGHTFMPSSGIDTAKLGIPHDLGEWSRGG